MLEKYFKREKARIDRELEEKKTELARLDALIEAKKDILKQDNETCHFLRGIITDLSKMRVHNNVNIDSIKN